MFSDTECSVCLSKEVKIYCSCQQLFLCGNCQIKHKEHPMLNEEDLMNFSMSPKKSFKQSLLDHLEDLIKKVELSKAEMISKVESSKLTKINQDLPLISLNLEVHQLLQKDDSIVYLSNENNQVVQYSLMNKKIQDLDIQLNTSIDPPFWLLKWNDYLILVGGNVRLDKNRWIYKICLKTKTITEIYHMEHPTTLFYPIIFNDNLYIIGGRYGAIYTKRTISKKIICYCLNDNQTPPEFDMNYERYATAACLQNDKIFIISYNITDSLDVFDPLSNITTLVMLKSQSPIKIAFGSAMISHKNEIYLLTQDHFIKINEDYECLPIFEPESISAELSNENLNQSTHPVIFDNKIFCFGTMGYFSYELSTKSIYYECLFPRPNN